MAKRADDEGKSWPIWEYVAVSAEVAAELKYERQLRDAARRAEEAAARLLSEIPKDLPDAPPASSALAAWNGPTLKVFSWEALEQDRATMETLGQDSDDRQRKSAIHERLLQRGDYRRLARLPDDWRTQLDQIEVLFPNFTAVVDYLRAMFAVAEFGETSPHLDPLLFNGPPGVGKSLFAERLGDFFGSGYRRVNMENAQTNAQLAGSDEFWSNSKTGAVFDALVEGDYANPLFLLDEVDKVRGRQEFDPLGALYSLLEPATAKTFRDLSMPRIALDASRIYWLLTSNEVSSIAAPLLSRIRRFDIPSPTPDQAVTILNTVYQAVQQEVRLPVAMAPLAPAIVATLSRVVPRRQRQILREAIGRTLYAGRREISVHDLRLPDDAEMIGRRMGF